MRSRFLPAGRRRKSRLRESIRLFLLTACGAAAAAEAAAADACRDAALAASPNAETLCSDAIARLSYQGAAAPAELSATAAGQTALAAAYNNRAMARISAGNLAGAADDLGEALTLAGDHWAIYLNRGNLRLAESQPGAALADYARARTLSAASAEAVLKNSVLAYRALGDLDRASNSLIGAEAISGHPGSDTPAAPDRRPR
ncbi:MAG TPA: hypothetical protein VIS76_13055 [Pseudomonadales bacterium]